MNAQEAKNYLQSRLPDMVVEVVENYSNQYTTGATRFIFTKGEQKANLMFNKGVTLDTSGLDGIVNAITKKFSEAPAPVEQPETKVLTTEEMPKIEHHNPVSVSYDLYTAAKRVVETYEKENPMT